MKTRVTFFTALFLLSSALLMWGCSDDNNSRNLAGPGNELTDEELDDLADDFASTIAGPGEGVLRVWLDTHPGGGGLRGAEGAAALDDTVNTSWNGFNVVIVRHYYDDDGNRFEFYNPETSVRMARLLWIDGTVVNQSGRRTVTLDHFDSTMVFGLQPSGEHYILRGTGEREVESEFSSRFRQNVKTLTAVYTWTVNDVIVHHNRSLHPYPLDGSIAVNAVITRTHRNPGRNFEETVHVSLVVHFDGSRYALVVINDGRQYWIDLAEGMPLRIRP